MNKIPSDMLPGTIHKTNNYGSIEIVEYKSSMLVEVRFLDTGTVTVSMSHNIRNGRVMDRMLPSINGVGYVGIGDFETGKSGSPNLAYTKWRNMLERCYPSRNNNKNKSYDNCTVCEEWHNFQNFAKWFYDNYPSGGGEWHLDKDIKHPGNRVYSPDNCTFVSGYENIMDSNSKRMYERKFISPNGDIVKVVNVSEFCRDNNLSRYHINSVYNGNRKHHKGWKKG